jgi:hypothetical protein
LALDQSQSLAAPTLLTLTPVAGGTFPANTYYVVITTITPWGETIASNEVSVTLSGGNGSFQVGWSGGQGVSATGLNVYAGVATGAENEVTRFSTPLVNPTISAYEAQAAATPPPTNSAYLPDTDGSYLRASTVFRWLSSALHESSRIAGGLPDYGGFPSVINWATYVVPGEWTRMIQPWYDGYPVSFSNTGAFFKRNIVTSSILAGWAVSFYNNQLGVELWPQPARTATQTTLASAMTVADTSATLTSTGGFLLPTYGMVRFGTEICAYNGISGNQLVGLIRGLGGTVPAAWASTTQVNELNAFFQGRRVFSADYTPGQSNVSLPIPSGWGDTLVDFMLAKFYETERDAGAVTSHMKSFTDRIALYMRMNRQIAGPQQVGNRDYQFVVFGGTRFGGNVIP